MLIFKSIILSCLLFGAVEALAAQPKAADPKNDKPTDHLHLAKRSSRDKPTGHPPLAKRSNRDKPTGHPNLARRTVDKRSEPTIPPKLVKRSMHEPFSDEPLA
ncbi:hypothetical protein FNYG_00226 [Fusarium nygamai]|uniref:Uncharacterized protein n=1 Tax=Gibberella nygamai TaxID=42673 RepID=A0A2K0WW65_GIBNY|nr:hypothetical protein FNYG_00226 [Fusarium nygamai]